jgi:hypothetical protein
MKISAAASATPVPNSEQDRPGSIALDQWCGLALVLVLISHRFFSRIASMASAGSASICSSSSPASWFSGRYRGRGRRRTGNGRVRFGGGVWFHFFERPFLSAGRCK